MEPVSRRINGNFCSTCISNELTAKARGLLLPPCAAALFWGQLGSAHRCAQNLGWGDKFPSNVTPKRRARERPTNSPVKSSGGERRRRGGKVAWSSERRAAAATHAFQISLILPAWRRDCHAPLATLFSQRGNGSKRVLPLHAFVTKSRTGVSSKIVGQIVLSSRSLDKLANKKKKGQQQVSRR